MFNLQRSGVFLAVLLLSVSCGLKERKIKARANGVRAHLGGTMAYFAAEAATICGALPEAETNVVPPFDAACSRGCRCASSAPADADPRTVYDCEQWRIREWQLLRFMGAYTLDETVNPVVYFHHQAKWRRTERGCQLHFTVYGDLDADGVYSTYTVMTETTPDGALGEWADESLLWE